MMSNKEWVIVDKTKLTAIADTVRATTKSENLIEIDDLSGEVARAIQIGSGLNTYDATADPSEIMQGETAYVNGVKITGTFTIENELNSQEDLLSDQNTKIAELAEILARKASGGGEQATPEISIGVDGLITATAGTKTSTYQLAFQEAKTITPGNKNQIAISSGYYTGGDIIVSGDDNLIAENIKEGISIFGISGTHAGSNDGDEDLEMLDQMIEGTLVNYVNNTASKIRDYAFEGYASLRTVNFTECSHIGQEAFATCTSLTTASFENCLSMASSAFLGCAKLATISFPVCKSVYWKAFSGCKSLTTLDLPSCTYIGGYAFQGCIKLSTLSLPLCRTIYSSTFQSCSALTTVSLPAINMIGSTAFGNCKNLKTFYLAGSTLCAISGSNVFTGTGITSTSGSIYVNASLVDSYKTATNWTYFSNVIHAIE